MPPEVIVAITFGVCLALIAFILIMVRYQQKSGEKTQRDLSDRDLIQLISDQPDQLLSPHQLRDQSGLSLTQARSRLSKLFWYGITNKSTNRKARNFFGLKDPLRPKPELELSPEPFLTVEDLLKIFEHYDNRVTGQELIMATGLPLSIIKREMKFFEDQGIVQRLSRHDQMGTMVKKFFVLQEPYRSNPEKFQQKAGVLDLQLKEILHNHNLLV